MDLGKVELRGRAPPRCPRGREVRWRGGVGAVSVGRGERGFLVLVCSTRVQRSSLCTPVEGLRFRCVRVLEEGVTCWCVGGPVGFAGGWRPEVSWLLLLSFVLVVD